MGLNKQQRKYWYSKIVYDSYGEFCQGCGVAPFPSFAIVLPETPILISKLNLNYWINGTKGKTPCTILYIDHIDNDDSNNVIENFQLLCPSCNHIKNPKRNGDLLQIRQKTPEMIRGDKQENAFRNYAKKEVIAHDWIETEDLIYAGAEYLTDFENDETISPETCKRYLGKMLSSTGVYAEKNGYVTFKYKLPQLDEWLNQINVRREKTIETRKKLSDSYE